MTEECITPLRRRMIEDMSVRHFASKTQHDYIRTVMKLTRFLGRSPDTATNEDLRCFQLHLTENRAGAPIINSTVSASRFFFTVTLSRADAAQHLTFVHEPRKRPEAWHEEQADASIRVRACRYRRENHWRAWRGRVRWRCARSLDGNLQGRGATDRIVLGCSQGGNWVRKAPACRRRGEGGRKK